MKRVFPFLIVLIIFSCNEPQNDSLNKQEAHFNEDSNTVSFSKQTEQSYSIDYIRSMTIRHTDTLDMTLVNAEKLKDIPKEFIEKYISPNEVKMGFDKYLNTEYPEAFKFYQFKEFNEFYLFTFIYEDETCCRWIYGCTLNKDSFNVINIGVLAYSGADGNWTGKKYGRWFNESGIELTQVSYYSPEDDSNSEFDTTWVEIQLEDNGLFNYIEHHSVKYIGN
tara:strand:- start:13840 stop:14505 length:666 start_codon:yes stop_codon:yes gene_type:complete